MMLTEGSGGSQPQLTSNVSVDPGAIQSYARFLGEMNDDLQHLHQKVGQLASIEASAFGAYVASPQAAQRSSHTVTTERDFLGQLVATLNQLTEGTHELARDYSDLEELNMASGHDVNALLAGTESDSKHRSDSTQA